MRLQLFPQDEVMLRKKSTPLANIDGQTQSLVENMFSMMRQHDGIGLAAVQVGVPQRVFVMDVSESQDNPLCFINPEIVEQSGEIEWEEGCLSIPGTLANVTRSKSILLQGLDVSGKVQQLEMSDLAAICAQHEIDHLDGKLFIDKLSRLKYQRIRQKLLKEA